jgi:hypothetical protein
MDAKLARLVRGGGDHAALIPLSANNNGFSFQRGVKEFFHGDKERVHIDMEDGAWEGGLVRGSHVDRNSSSRDPRESQTRIAFVCFDHNAPSRATSLLA